MCSHCLRGNVLTLVFMKRAVHGDVHFDKAGISYIFCNIHPEMSAVVVALDTPYYGISDRRGQVEITGVPAGKYVLRVWHESALPETLKAMTREITISPKQFDAGNIAVSGKRHAADTQEFVRIGV